MKRKGFILIPLTVLFLPLFVFKFHEPNSGSEFQISAPLKNNQSPASHFRGHIQTLAIDEIDKSTGKLKCRFVQYLKAEDGKRYQIEDKKGALKKIKPAEMVSISGNLTDHKIVVDKVRLLPSTQKTSTAESTSDTLGEQKTLVALFNYPDDTSKPFTIQDAEDQIINNSDSVDKFFRENSYEKTWLNADFIDWQTLPHNSTYYTQYSNYDNYLLADAIDTLDPIVNFQDYARLIFIYGDASGISLAESTVGKWKLSSSKDGTFTASVISLSGDWIENDNPRGISHELGHSFGFSHASAIASYGPYFLPESVLDPTSSSGITYGAYDDIGDTMGSYYEGHFSTIWKSQAQWIDDSQMQEATKSGECTIDQVELSSAGIKALKIPIGKDTNKKDFYYWIEYRKNLGAFDTRDGADYADESGIIQIRTQSSSTYDGNSIRFREQTKIINLTPIQIKNINEVSDVSAGGNHNLALKSDGTVWAWGSNYCGQLGNGTTVRSKVPVQASNLSGITAVSGADSNSYALKSDGTVWAWGNTYSGQLGNGTTTTVSDGEVPVQVSNLSSVTAIAGASALKSDGTVWAWGWNLYGQLGDGTNEGRSTPVQTKGLSDITAIASGTGHNLAIKSDGTVWAWGYNDDGQLGDGTKEDSNIPVQVQGISDVIAVAAGGWQSLALKSDGTVWAWGNNGDGQLGDGTKEDSDIPVQVQGISDVIAITGGMYHSLALKSDGTVWAWGYNDNGQLGDGTKEDSNIPVQVEGLVGITKIDSCNSNNLALDSDNKVWEWGSYDISLYKFYFRNISIETPFYDPYRGVRIKLIEKTGSGTESKARLKVALSGFHIEPAEVLNFGNVYINSPSIQTATVTNNSGGEIEIGDISISGQNSKLFTITADGCSNKTLQNGESCNVTISFSPDSAGNKFGILSVPNNDPIRPKATISLYGYGSTEITSIPTPTITPTPFPTPKPTIVPTPIACDDSYEPNDSKEKAYGYLTSGSSYEGKICSNSDVDWYKVNITSAGTISLSLTDQSSNDFDLELYDSSDTLIASSNSGAGADESIRYDVTTTGDYYIKVYEFYGSYNSTTPYTLAYSFTNCEIESVGVFPGTVKLKRESSKDVTVTVTGTDDCPVEGTTVTATIKVGKNRISISPISQSTDEDGKATFKVTAGNMSGRARIMFASGDKEKIFTVKIK